MPSNTLATIAGNEETNEACLESRVENTGQDNRTEITVGNNE
jgi:hypothetical protein